MALTPDSNIRLIKCPLTLDNKNQLTFQSPQKQYEYFSSLTYVEIEECQYIRKDNVIRFPAHIDDIINYNYVMYQNNNYTHKWFYAFITNMEYKADNLTYISITTDVWQTWQFDLTFKESFIEREHLSTLEDTVGANLVPESLETGEYIINSNKTVTEMTPYYIVAFLGDHLASDPVSQNGKNYNGIYSAVTFILTNSINMLLNVINSDGSGDKIMTAFTVPEFSVKSQIEYSQTPNETVYFYKELPSFKQDAKTITLSTAPTSFGDYTPKNKKLLTYPYQYFGFNPPNGSKKVFRFEDFSQTPSFKAISEINPNPEIVFIPQNYKNISDNITESVNLTGYPTISYKNDYFNTWLAQNSQIVSLQMQQEEYNAEMQVYKQALNSESNMIGSAISGNPLTIASSSIGLGLNLGNISKNHDFYIKQQMAQIEKQKLLPDSASLSSSNCTLLGYNYIGTNLFSYYQIKKQFAKRIDKYFNMYGYATNIVKVPNINNRSNWNYVKTIGVNILADIPQVDLNTIKDLFNNGITLWHKPDYFLDYSQTNS